MSDKYDRQEVEQYNTQEHDATDHASTEDEVLLAGVVEYEAELERIARASRRVRDLNEGLFAALRKEGCL